MSEEDLSRLEQQIGRLLRIGVLLCGAALLLGLALAFANAPAARRVIQAGLVLLMAIPVARIVASFFDALRRRDRLLAWATTYVLVVMAATLVASLLQRSN